jgi:hypothetical protein
MQGREEREERRERKRHDIDGGAEVEVTLHFTDSRTLYEADTR